MGGKQNQNGSGTMLAKITVHYTYKEGIRQMSKYVVICEAEDCEAENEDYQDDGGTYWFVCSTCGWPNEVVYDWSK